MTDNYHATLIDIEGRGILIAGPSGSGKTMLALHLLRRCRAASVTAQIVADDQVLLSAENRSLTGTVPENLRGKVEVRGHGIVTHDGAADQTQIALHVMLTEPDRAVRMWDGQMFTHQNIEIKNLILAAHQTEAAANAILATLGYPPEI